jgi:hypothetical protein
MRRCWIILSVVLLMARLTLTSSPAANDERISGPFVHESLAIYLVHGASTEGPVPLTLDEALAKKTATVHETGDVNSLEIENIGDEPVFVQSGDIVKGGQQDRALTASLQLLPHSGRTRIAVFCVEHGRWSGRDGEDTRTFSSARMALPSREAKIAIRAPAEATGADTSSRQLEVWRTVAKFQEQLSGNLGAPVASPRSQTSLQLALENDALAKAEAEYLGPLQAAGEKDADVVGYAFAVNGKLSAADIYPSNGLFRKMWPKLIKSAVAEAIAARSATDPKPAPTVNAVESFFQSAEHGAKVDQEVAHGVKLESRDGSKALYFETKPANALIAAPAFIHRNYLAK